MLPFSLRYISWVTLTSILFEAVVILPFSLESVLSEGNTFQMSNNFKKNQRVNNSISIYLIDWPVRFVSTSEELCEAGRISKDSKLLESQTYSPWKSFLLWSPHCATQKQKLLCELSFFSGFPPWFSSRLSWLLQTLSTIILYARSKAVIECSYVHLFHIYHVQMNGLSTVVRTKIGYLQ